MLAQLTNRQDLMNHHPFATGTTGTEGTGQQSLQLHGGVDFEHSPNPDMYPDMYPEGAMTGAEQVAVQHPHA